MAVAIEYLRRGQQYQGGMDANWQSVADRARGDLHQLLQKPDPSPLTASDKTIEKPSPGASYRLGDPSKANGCRVDRPWILTGHQVEFYHAGVWAKVLLADALAKKTGGTAVDILVDHDTVDHLGLTLPEKDMAGDWHKVWHTWGYPNSIAADGLSAPSTQPAAQWMSGVLKSAEENGIVYTDALEYFIHAWRHLTASDYVTWIGTARAEFEREFGLRVRHVRSSQLCGSIAWLAFVAAWISNAMPWTSIYNQAITDYRKRHHVNSPGRPIPPLAVSSELIELPFWIYHRGSPRERLTIQADGRSISMPGRPLMELPPPGDHPLKAAESLERLLAEHQLCIRPRALTLTLYVRTFLADLFIHGIGGAMYDEMTDQIAAQMGLPIGGYQCASAGWLLSAGQTDGSDDRPLSELKQWRHHLKHNPHLLYQNGSPPQAVAALLAERTRLIASLERRSPPGDMAARATRRENFTRLHAINAFCHAQSDAINQIDHAMADAQLRRQRQAVLGDREYFFALHGWHSLRELQQIVAST